MSDDQNENNLLNEILRDDPEFLNNLKKEEEERKKIEQELPPNVKKWPKENPRERKVIIEIESIDKVIAKKIDWIWKDKIAIGKMTLFAGEPGVGKSQLLLYIASIISNGGKFHLEATKIDQGKVLLISGEDSAEDTIKPRLAALGSNLENIDYVKGIKKIDKASNAYYDPICLIEDMIELEEIIKKNKYKLIIVDPISVYLGSIDENKNKEIRGALSQLSGLVERHQCGLIINSHFTKPSGNSQKGAINRVMGSIGFAAAARIVFGIMKDPENPDRRLFVPIKNNIGDDKQGYVYTIKSVVVGEAITTSRIDWLNERIEQSANDILNHNSVIKSPILDETKKFLTELLKFGSVPLAEIRKKYIQEVGGSIDRLYSAKVELNIYETKSIAGKNGKVWMLPAK